NGTAALRYHGEMTLKEGLLVAPTLLLLTAVTARAQETPRVGLTIGYPASVGVIWHISDRVAVRPDLAASWTSFKPSTSTGARDDGSSATIGLSGLFYLAKHDALQIYVTPRVGYLRTTATVQTTVSIFSPTGTLSPSTLTYNTTDSTYT